MLGVASAALWAAGCSWPKPSATPISRWEFDETSSAEGVFEDRGPAHVLMIHVGTWADLTTDPLVAGDDGTSAYTDGSAYATIPADVPAYNLAAITISFYYQRKSASDKHILLAAGDGPRRRATSRSRCSRTAGCAPGTRPGRRSALLRGHGRRHRHQSAGRHGASDRSLAGAAGARLYLDGAELTTAAIPENTNGWNNSRVKYLGRWTDGVQAPAVGVFDRLRIWNSAAHRRRDRRARSRAVDQPTRRGRSRASPVSPARRLRYRPSPNGWSSDEPDPAATKYVSNQNRGNGSGWSPANAQEVQAALNGASPGQTFVAVCQTPGFIEFWGYTNGLFFPAGSSGTHVTLKARQGDGVVICGTPTSSARGRRTAASGRRVA